MAEARAHRAASCKEHIGLRGVEHVGTLVRDVVPAEVVRNRAHIVELGSNVVDPRLSMADVARKLLSQHNFP